MSRAVLSVQNLTIALGQGARQADIVRGVDLHLRDGETLGLVGESGSGKSMLSLGLLGLLPKPDGRITQGRIEFEGQNITAAKEIQMRRLRGNRLAIVFQDPTTALNPYLTCAVQLAEVLQTHRGLTYRAARALAVAALEDVGITQAYKTIDSFPHMLSGGMRQRVMIAMALLCAPALLIADEPTTALDVCVQAQILSLLKKLQKAHNTAVLLISHDLRVVASQAERIAVMYAGRIVEQGDAQTVFAQPQHPYTRGLLDCLPQAAAPQARLRPIGGQAPEPWARPPGCAFWPRCPRAQSLCRSLDPPLRGHGPRHQVACHNPLPLAAGAAS